MQQQLPPFHYLERYRNEGTRTYSSHASYTAAGNKYRPDSAHAQFDLQAYELPRDQLIVYRANPPQALELRYLGVDWALFCVHPQLLEMFPDDVYVRQILEVSRGFESIPVVPSSSTRTLYVAAPGRPHALKVHFPFKISRYTRKMRDEVIEQAVNVSRELERSIQKLDKRFAFLREVLGVVHKDLKPDSARSENWGYLVRDMIPFPYQSIERTLVPGFALYGEDYYDAQTPLLLFELIKDQDPVSYVLENIMLPIIGHWVDCFLQFGFILEPHGQNVLLELNEENKIDRIVHRDLSVGIDMRRRRHLGLPNDGLNSYNQTEQSAFHSIAYDRFMGGHFFDRIAAACLKKYPDLSREEFRQPCLEAFARRFPDYADYFPETVWYFSEERDQFNKPFYQDTGAAPEWRP